MRQIATLSLAQMILVCVASLTQAQQPIPPTPLDGPSYLTAQVDEPAAPAASAPSESANSALSSAYTDKVMDLVDFRDIPLREALTALSEQADGVNFVASPEAAKQSVELVLQNVTPKAALEILAESNGLWFREKADANAIYVYTNAERQQVVPDLKAIQRQINEAFPNSFVELSAVGEKVLLKGEARDTIEAEQILKTVIAGAIRLEDDDQEQDNVGVNLTRTRFGFDEAQTLGINGSGRLQGREIVPGADQVINLLRVPGGQQVMLKVVVAEVKRRAARSIGMNFNLNRDVTDAAGTPGLAPLVGSQLFDGALANISPVNLDAGEVSLAIRALRDLSLAKTIAEPNLTTMHGQRASFHVGGQFPVPSVSGFTNSGLQSVSFVPFGCQISFTPFIMDRDQVRLILSAELSSRDPDASTNVGGAPAAGGTPVQDLSTRNFQTTVELRDGQTFAIAGLISSGYQATSQRVPFFGDLPLFGRGASNNDAIQDETELVILVTPHIVQPIDPHERRALPGSDVIEPDDVEFFLLGQMESRNNENFRSSIRNDHFRQKSFKQCQDRIIIGPVGYTDDCECLSSH